MHKTTGRLLRRWLRQAGLKPGNTIYEVVEGQKRRDRLSFGLAKPMMGSNVYVAGTRADSAGHKS
jgi:hypothetical protein